jgi:mannose-1-phosphate guanylyltransferase
MDAVGKVTMDGTQIHGGRWAVILAGGEGRRLAAYTRRVTGRPIPKQFCHLLGKTSLLEQTLERVSLSIEKSRTLIALTRTHQCFYTPLLRDFGPWQLVIQPQNRETAPAILYSLLRLSIRDPLASVALFPADHHVSDDRAFMTHVDLAFRALEVHRNLAILLGIPPEGPETGYGWIEPGDQVASPVAHIYGVRSFWEKPRADVAELLWRRGCLWNSLVLVARLEVLLEMIARQLPSLYAAFRGVKAAMETGYEGQVMELLYSALTPSNFSCGVLARANGDLGVLPVAGVEWSDLGEARRVLSIQSRVQMRRLQGHA